MGQRTVLDQQMIDLIIDEMSAVDRAANRFVGWNVVKAMSKGGQHLDAETLARAMAEAERIHKDASDLLGSLGANEGLLADAPENVQSAAQTLRDWLSTVAGTGEEEEAKATGFLARMFALFAKEGDNTPPPPGDDTEVEIDSDKFDAFLAAYSEGKPVDESVATLATTGS